MRLRALLAVALLTNACTTTYAIPKSELRQLDGWKDDGASLMTEVGNTLLNVPRSTRWVRDEEGDKHPFSVDTPLRLQRGDGEALTERYVQVKVDALRFEGIPLAKPDSPVVVSLEEVTAASLRRFSLGKTLLLLGGIGLGVLATVTVVGIAIDPRDGDSDGDPNIPCGHGCSL